MVVTVVLSIFSAIKCLALPEVPNGKWHPEECVTNRKLPFGQACKMVCNPGFSREGPEIRECGYKGWSLKKDISKCLGERIFSLQKALNTKFVSNVMLVTLGRQQSYHQDII